MISDFIKEVINKPTILVAHGMRRLSVMGGGGLHVFQPACYTPPATFRLLHSAHGGRAHATVRIPIECVRIGDVAVELRRGRRRLVYGRVRTRHDIGLQLWRRCGQHTAHGSHES